MVIKNNKKNTFVCECCGIVTSKWQGQCHECQQWNSIIPVKDLDDQFSDDKCSSPKRISEISLDDLKKKKTGLSEFDRVLGGGIYNGSLMLLSGEPGVGKSSLILELIRKIDYQKILYISGEESESQLAARIKRFNINNNHLLICHENIWENIERHINHVKPDLIILDSIQTISLLDHHGSSGGSSLIKEVTNKIMQKIKKSSTTCFIIGHITKDGAVAGPKVLEHMVDIVLTFKKEDDDLRVLRAKKNRFGSTSEVGLFEMRENNLCDFIEDESSTHEDKRFGITKTMINDGSRDHVISVESLIVENRFGQGKRVVINFDMKRLNMFLAILKKYINIDIDSYDIYLNLSGVLKNDSKYFDLAIIASILSSYFQKTINSNILFYGEVDLLGRVKSFKRINCNVKGKLKHYKIYSNLTNIKESDDLTKRGFHIEDIVMLKDMMLKAS